MVCRADSQTQQTDKVMLSWSSDSAYHAHPARQSLYDYEHDARSQRKRQDQDPNSRAERVPRQGGQTGRLCPPQAAAMAVTLPGNHGGCAPMRLRIFQSSSRADFPLAKCLAASPISQPLGHLGTPEPALAHRGYAEGGRCGLSTETNLDRMCYMTSQTSHFRNTASRLYHSNAAEMITEKVG